MNKQKLKEEQNRKLYKIPGGANFQLRVKNAVYLSPHNTLKHEIAKSIGAYSLLKYGDIKFSDSMNQALEWLQEEFKEVMKDFPKDKSTFITEAVPKKEPDRRVDLVRLSDNTLFEFETSPKIKKEGACTIYIPKVKNG